MSQYIKYPTPGSGGTGTVTSVGLTAPAIFLVAGSPVTTSGTIAITLATEVANTVWAGPTTGADATPTFRALVAADIPTITSAKISDFSTAARALFSGTAPVSYNSGTGVFSMHVADASNNGYLSSTDWTTFNNKGSGSVTSVGLSASGIFNITNTPITTSGNISLGVVGTSGGIPYFSNGTTLSTSAALAANQLVLGGGAGVTPATLGTLGTATTVLHGNAGGAPTFGAVSLTADVSGTLPVGNGGTGITSGTQGGVPYFSASNTIASSAALAQNQLVLGGGTGTPATLGSLGTTSTVLHGNASGAPTFGAIVNADITNGTIDLTTKVTGVLPIANGGTNSTATATAGGVGYGTGTAHAYTSAGTSGQALVSGGSGAPTFANIGNNYFNGTMSGIVWSTTSTTFADPSVTSGTNTLTTRWSNGLTVTAAGSNAPAITFTPSSSSAVYEVSVGINTMFNSSAGNDTFVRLTDGTNVIGVTGMQGTASTEGTPGFINQVYVPGTGSAVTLKLQIGVSAGTGKIQEASGVTGATTLEWKIVQLK